MNLEKPKPYLKLILSYDSESSNLVIGLSHGKSLCDPFLQWRGGFM